MNKYIKRNWKLLLLAFLFSTISAIFAVRVQFLKGDVLDFAIASNTDNTLRYGFLLGLFIIFELGFFYLYDLSRGRFVVNSMKEVRSDYFQSILFREYPEFLKEKQGEYISRYTNQMDLIENQYFSTIPLLAEISIKILIVSIFLFIVDYRLAIVTLVLLTTPLYIPKLVDKKLEKAQVEFVAQFEDHLKQITDWLNGFEVIKNFSIEKTIKEKFEQSNKMTMEKSLRKKDMGYLTRSLSALLSYFSHFIILIFAAYLVLIGDFSPGDFFVAVGMIDQLSYPIISVSYLIQDLISVKPVHKTILAFISKKTVRHGSTEISTKDFKNVVFNSVYFSYDEKKDPVLRDLNLDISKSEKYLLQGASGSGKTTSMNLLLDYYPTTSGDIKINNVKVSEIKNLYSLITVMRQDATLFHDTLRNNITMYQDIPDDKLISALSQVGLGHYGDSKHLSMIINERGTNLSGGEKRRVTLARSLLRETPILILDEPIANLDDENAKAIESLILSIKDKTVIVISHQFSKEYATKLDNIIRFNH